MMRKAIIAWIVFAVFLSGWGYFYWLVVSFSCSDIGGLWQESCKWRPWQLQGDAFMMLVLVPALIAIGALVWAVVATRRARVRTT